MELQPEGLPDSSPGLSEATPWVMIPPLTFRAPQGALLKCVEGYERQEKSINSGDPSGRDGTAGIVSQGTARPEARSALGWNLSPLQGLWKNVAGTFLSPS